MKKIFLLIFLACGYIVNAQITFEHAYDSASTLWSQDFPYNNQLIVVHFEVSGDRYVRINKPAKSIDIYDMSHAWVKTISYASFPDPDPGFGIGMYLSENLFDLDPGIEFMYTGEYPSFGGPFTNIYNEDGSIIFSDSASPMVIANTPEQRLIYNTSSGTKMILSYVDHHAKVFSLPGTLSTAIAQANESLVEAYTMSVSNPYPNPTVGSTNIDFILPKGATMGEIVFFDMNGVEIRRFKVNRTLSSLLVSTTDIPAGTYLYQLQVNGDASAAKRMVVIK